MIHPSNEQDTPIQIERNRRNLPFSSSGTMPVQRRFSISAREIDSQETSIQVELQVNVKSTPPRTSIQRQGLEQDRDRQKRGAANHGSYRRNNAKNLSQLAPQDARRYNDEELSQGKKVVSVSSYFRNRYFAGDKKESFETLLSRYET